MARVNYNAIMLIGGFLLLAVTFSFAQVTGEIRGVVLDANGGEPLARVQVELATPRTEPSPTPRGVFPSLSCPAGTMTSGWQRSVTAC